MKIVEIVDILEAFGCDMQHPGMPDFIFVFNAAVANVSRGQKAGAGAALRDLAAVKGMYYLALNSRMRAAIRPILEADPEALKYFEIELSKRTPCGVAESLARQCLAHAHGGG